MSNRIRCPNCRNSYQVESTSIVGKAVKCSQCSFSWIVSPNSLEEEILTLQPAQLLKEQILTKTPTPVDQLADFPQVLNNQAAFPPTGASCEPQLGPPPTSSDVQPVSVPQKMLPVAQPQSSVKISQAAPPQPPQSPAPVPFVAHVQHTQPMYQTPETSQAQAPQSLLRAESPTLAGPQRDYSEKSRALLPGYLWGFMGNSRMKRRKLKKHRLPFLWPLSVGALALLLLVVLFSQSLWRQYFPQDATFPIGRSDENGQVSRDSGQFSSLPSPERLPDRTNFVPVGPESINSLLNQPQSTASDTSSGQSLESFIGGSADSSNVSPLLPPSPLSGEGNGNSSGAYNPASGFENYFTSYGSNSAPSETVQPPGSRLLSQGNDDGHTNRLSAEQFDSFFSIPLFTTEYASN